MRHLPSSGGRALPPPTGPATRLRALDGLRFAAALGVLLYHFTSRDTTVWGGPVGDRFPLLGEVGILWA